MMELLQFLEKTVWVLVVLCGLLTVLAMKLAPAMKQKVFHSYCKLVLNAFACAVLTRLLDMVLEVEGAEVSPVEDFDWYLAGLVCMGFLVIGQHVTFRARNKQK